MTVAGYVLTVLVAVCVAVWLLVLLMVPWWLALRTWAGLRRR
jgi:hypothetical protein